jgi:hypothetical protein
MDAHAHTHAQTDAHAQTHMNAHTRKHAHASAHVHAWMRGCTHRQRTSMLEKRRYCTIIDEMAISSFTSSPTATCPHTTLVRNEVATKHIRTSKQAKQQVKRANRQTNKQTNRQTNGPRKQTNKQTDQGSKQTNKAKLSPTALLVLRSVATALAGRS